MTIAAVTAAAVTAAAVTAAAVTAAAVTAAKAAAAVAAATASATASATAVAAAAAAVSVITVQMFWKKSVPCVVHRSYLLYLVKKKVLQCAHQHVKVAGHSLTDAVQHS